MFQKPQPLPVSRKVLQYTSNLYGSTAPICIAGPSWLLSLQERETQQYTSHSNFRLSTKPSAKTFNPSTTARMLPLLPQDEAEEGEGEEDDEPDTEGGEPILTTEKLKGEESRKCSSENGQNGKCFREGAV